MSIDLVAAALWLPMEGNRKLVLIALCERANLITGYCNPGRDEIAVRASLSERRVTPHLTALDKAGYISSKRRGNARQKQTTARWVNVARILAEGEEARQALLSRRWGSRDDPSPNPFQASLLGDAQTQEVANDQGTFANDQGTNPAVLEDAVTLENRHEPSPLDDVGVKFGDRPLTAMEDLVLSWMTNLGHLPTPRSKSDSLEQQTALRELRRRGLL